MVGRKNKHTALVVCLMGICILVLTFSGNVLAKSKKARLSVGFTTEEALANLQTGEAWQYTEMGAVFWPLVYDQLWILGPPPNYDPLPMLATRWETEDFQTWRFYLQKNAKFHDGKPVKAADVAFTLWYLPKSDPSWDFPDNATARPTESWDEWVQRSFSISRRVVTGTLRQNGAQRRCSPTARSRRSLPWASTPPSLALAVSGCASSGSGRRRA